MRAGAGAGLAGAELMEGKPAGGRLDLHVKHLPAAIHACLGIHPVRAKYTAIAGIFGELGSLQGVGGAAIGTAALGLFTFRVSHDDSWSVPPAGGDCVLQGLKSRLVRLAPEAVKIYNQLENL